LGEVARDFMAARSIAATWLVIICRSYCLTIAIPVATP